MLEIINFRKSLYIDTNLFCKVKFLQRNFLQSKLNTDVTSESHNKAKKNVKVVLHKLVQRSVKSKHDLLTVKANKA